MHGPLRSPLYGASAGIDTLARTRRALRLGFAVLGLLTGSFGAAFAAEPCAGHTEEAPEDLKVVRFPCDIGSEPDGSRLTLVSYLAGGGHKVIFELPAGRALALEWRGQPGGRDYIEREVAEMADLAKLGFPMIDFERSVRTGPCFSRHPEKKPKRLILVDPAETCRGYAMALYPRPRYQMVKEHGGYELREEVLSELRRRGPAGEQVIASYLRNLSRLLALVNEKRLDLFDLQFFLDTDSGRILIFDTSLKRRQSAESDPLRWYKGRFEAFEGFLKRVEQLVGPDTPEP